MKNYILSTTALFIILISSSYLGLNAQTYSIGAPNPNIGSYSSITVATYFLIFDVFDPSGVIIETVDVYPTVAGATFTISLRNSSSVVIATYTGTTTVSSGPQTVPVNFLVPAGTGFGIGMTTNPGMIRNTTGAAFPYTVPGLMSITGQSFNTSLNTYYYWFYNIQIRLPFPPQPNDAGIAAITSPTSPSLPGNNPITVTLANYGTDTLISANIGWAVNGVFQSTIPWSGNIAPAANQPGISLGTFNFSLGTHTIQAWSSLPNGAIDSISQNDTTTKSLIVCNLLSGTFTVGGAAADYPTVQAAANAAAACGISGPVTFNILPGIYNEQVTIPVIAGSSGLNTVTFQSSTGIAADVIVQYAPAGTADNWVVRLNGSDYVTLQHMTIKTATGTGSYGYVIELTNGANYNTINGNVIESIPGATASTTACIYSGTSMDEYNIISNNTLRHGYYSVYLSGPSTTSFENGNIVADNTMENYYYYGGNILYQRDVIISGNTMSNASNSGTIYSLRPYYCYDGVVITKNKITLAGTSTNYGIYAYANTGTATAPGLIANNVINQTATSTGTVYTLYFYNAAYMRVYHNTIQAKSTSTSNYGVYVSSGNTSMEFVNNILVNEGNGYTIYGTVANLQQMTACNYNNYYATGSNLAYAGAAMTNLAAWKTATGLDANSISANPVFAMPNILIPTSGAVNNLGTPLALVPDDINGVLRDPVTPDMGAYEFSPVTTEAAHMGIIQPEGGCDLGLQAVEIQIKNQGAQTITSGLTASYRVVGSSTVVTEPVTTPISSGQTLSFTFSSPLNLTVTNDSTFMLVSWISLVGDPFGFNDTTTKTVNSMVGPPPPQLVNAMVSNGQSATLTIINPDTNLSYFWFDTIVGGTELAVGDTFVTPPLFNTTVYYVEGRTGSTSPVLLTEFNIGDPDAMEITNMTQNTLNLTGWKVVVNGQTYSNINTVGTVLMDLGVMTPGEVRYWTDATGNNYWGENLFWNPGAYPSYTGWAMIIDNMGNVADYVAWGWPASMIQSFSATINGFPITVGNAWVGDGIVNPSANLITRVAFDSNTASDWINQATGTIGTLNPGMVNVGGGTSGSGCPSIRVPDTVFVQAPVLFVNIGNDTSICQGDTLQMLATVTGGVPPYTYTWSPGNTVSNPSIPNPLAFPPINTVYTVTVVDQNGDYGTDVIIITVIPPPNVVFPPLPSVYINTPPFQLTGGMPAGGTYSGPGVTNNWFHPSVAGPGGHILTYTYATPVTGCTGSDVTSIYVDPSVGIESFGSGQGFAIWPNPSAGMVMLSIKAQDASMQLEVMDVQGKVVMDRRLINATGRYELDLTALPQGVYHIRLTGDTETYLQKLILH